MRQTPSAERQLVRGSWSTISTTISSGRSATSRTSADAIVRWITSQAPICDYLALRLFFRRQNNVPVFHDGKYRNIPKYTIKGISDIIAVTLAWHGEPSNRWLNHALARNVGQQKQVSAAGPGVVPASHA